MSESNWRVLDGEGNEQGPYSFQDLQGFYTSGNIDHQTMIWTEGLDQWVPAGQVEGLLPHVPQAAPVQTAPAGGMNLAPQIPGITPSQPLTENPAKIGAPRWLVNINLATCLGALFLFFLPWVELRCSNPDDKKGSEAAVGLPDKSLILTQTGFQSILGKTVLSEESVDAKDSDKGKTDSKPKPESDQALADLETEANPTEDLKTTEAPDSLGLGDEEGNYPPAHFVVLGILSLGLATLLGIIGFTGGGRTLLFLSQLFCLIAGVFIAIQIVTGFPILPSPRYAIAIGGDGAAFAAAMLQEVSYTKYTIWLILEIILLGSSLLFMIIAYSSRNTSTITIPQPGQPDQPQQPGAGLRFH